MQDQQRLGWKAFLEGFWAMSWHTAQQEYLNSKNSTKSTQLLLSKAQRRIWKIAWDLWMHRNNYLHTHLQSISTTDRESINAEVAAEWSAGISTLPQRFEALFRGTLQQRLNKSYQDKRRWLATIWSARERINPNYLANNPSSATDGTIRLKYQQWKNK